MLATSHLQVWWPKEVGYFPKAGNGWSGEAAAEEEGSSCRKLGVNGLGHTKPAANS